jgi:hypothetical protein
VELAYIVYIGLLVMMILFSISEVRLSRSIKKYTEKSLFRNPFAIIPILIFTIVIGLRYDVGIDYLWYKQHYDVLLNHTKYVDTYFEIGYLFVFKGLALLEVSFVWVFLITAFLQIYCIYYQSRKNLFLLPFIIFFYFVSSNFMYSLNIMRQIIAFNILFVGTRNIIDKKIYKWIAWCLLASLFHFTALVGMSFYFLNKNIIKNKYFAFLFLLLIYFVIQNIYINYFDLFFNKYLPLIMPNTSSEALASQDREITKNSGSGYFTFAMLLVYTLFIYHYQQCTKLYSKFGFVLFFNLAVIGVIIFPLVSYNILLDRINYYFYGFQFIVFAFYAHYFLIINKNKFASLMFILFMILMFVQFLSVISSGSNGISPFQFVSDF